MNIEIDPFCHELDSRFKVFHELMPWKVHEILLVSTPYDAWVMEEDCRLSERIVNEYRGLNLSRPPRFTWVGSAAQALKIIEEKSFDMVITMPRVVDMDAATLGREIKALRADLPVVVLSHGLVPSGSEADRAITFDAVNRTFVWSGDTDILVAMVKSVEDRINAAHDTEKAGIRIILFVEDSPVYLSSLLPIFYRELVSQTQSLIEGGLNEEHRLLTMRARPKILVAETYEKAMEIFKRFEPYVLGVICAAELMHQGQPDSKAGIDLLRQIQSERFDIPLLLTGSGTDCALEAAGIPAFFVDKHSATLHQQVRAFFKEHLGFGEFVFRNQEGEEIARTRTLKGLEEHLLKVPPESFIYHCQRNDFSRWLFARTETELAAKVRPICQEDFDDLESHRQFLADVIRQQRKSRQKGVVANFDAFDFDPETEFVKIGKGSLGGKARGLAFVAALLNCDKNLYEKYSNISIRVPQTLVITTDAFEEFVESNDLRQFAKAQLPDEAIAASFIQSPLPDWVQRDLKVYLQHVRYPLAIRSSSLLEDAQFRAYAGLYRTYMIPNDHPDLDQRLAHLVQAVKLVYASTYYQAPRAFSRRVGHRTEEEKMAVIIQQLVGERYGDFYYPAISGVAQSYNYYPFGRMKPEEGIATIVMGLGKMVVEGERSLRFCPCYPQLLPQRSTVDEIMANSQRYFYALQMGAAMQRLGIHDSDHLVRREVTDADEEPPVRILASTYVPQEHRIRDTVEIPGYRVLTFAQVLKYDLFPLAEILKESLAMGSRGMGCPVELEFSVNLPETDDRQPEFAFLQLRPMTARAEQTEVKISNEEIEKAVCYSVRALGNAKNTMFEDIIFVKPESFDPARTTEIARQIASLNADLENQQRKYLLIGPGRWGSADPWLGIPVNWADISGVGAVIEAMSEKLKAEPSQGSHFFHNITTLGINYISITGQDDDFIRWDWIQSRPLVRESEFVAHVRCEQPLILKVDGRTSRGVILSST